MLRTFWEAIPRRKTIAALSALVVLLVYVLPLGSSIAWKLTSYADPGYFNDTASDFTAWENELGLTGSAGDSALANALYQSTVTGSGASNLLAAANGGETTLAQAVSDGVLTASQASAATAATASAAIPSVGASAEVGSVAVGASTAGAAGATVVGAGAAAFAATNGVLRLVGVTNTGSICMGTGTDMIGSLVQWATGSDCGKYLQDANASRPNIDSPALSFPSTLWSSSAKTSGWTGINIKVDNAGYGGNVSVSAYLPTTGTVTGQTPATGCGSGGNTYSPTGVGGKATLGWSITFQNNPSGATGTGGTIYQGAEGDGSFAGDNTKTCYYGVGPHVGWDMGGLGDTVAQNGGWSNVIRMCVVSYSGACSANSTASGAAQQVTIGSPAVDPNRYVWCTIDDSSGTELDGPTQLYTEGSGSLPHPVCPKPTAGSYPNRVRLFESTVNNPGAAKSFGAATHVLLDQTIPTPKFGECVDGHCLLVLLKNGQDCVANAGLCTGWFTDPNKANVYTCRYGTHAVPLSECNLYANRWTTSGGANYDSKPDGSPSTNPGTGTQVAPAPSSTSSSTPTASTGSSAQPSASASASASAAPGSGTFPSWNPSQDPQTNDGNKPGNDPAPQDAGSPQNTPQCMETLWSSGFNPIAWVTVPVKCAMQWAFEPDPAKTQADVRTAQAAWAGTPPALVATAVTGWNFTPPPSGCAGVTVSLGFLPAAIKTNRSMTFFNACPGDPLQPYAAWVSLLLGFAFVLGGAYSIIRSVQGVVNYQGGVG